MISKQQIIEDWLPRYTGTSIDEFGDYILLTNFHDYVLRFSERYVRSDPISGRDFKALQEAAAARFADVDWLRETAGTTLAGIGGTIRTLAEIDQKTSGYPLDRVHGHTFSRERLDEIIGQLRGMTLRQREELPGLSRDRADLILAGAVILQQLMEIGRPLFRRVSIESLGRPTLRARIEGHYSMLASEMIDLVSPDVGSGAPAGNEYNWQALVHFACLDHSQ